MEDNKQVILLCGKDDCCPKLTIDKNRVEIDDDFGGRVRLTSEQFSLLKEKVQNGEL